ncbi:MAG: hypothetical protein QM674_03390 [Burkholderiaceae bacterium]
MRTRRSARVKWLDLHDPLGAVTIVGLVSALVGDDGWDLLCCRG